MGWSVTCDCGMTWHRGYKTWVQSQTQNKAQWLVTCGHVSASSQSLRFVLSLRMNSSFITSRPGHTYILCAYPVSHMSVHLTHCTLMNSFFWFDTIKLGYFISLLGVSDYNFHKNSVCVLFCQNIFFTFTNSVDPDEMQHYAAFHLGLHCLQKYLFWCFPSTEG